MLVTTILLMLAIGTVGGWLYYNSHRAEPSVPTTDPVTAEPAPGQSTPTDPVTDPTTELVQTADSPTASELTDASRTPAFILPPPWEWRWVEGERTDGTIGASWLPSVLLPEGTPLYFPLAGDVGRCRLAASPPLTGFRVENGELLLVAIMAENSLWPTDRLLWETFSCEKGEEMCRLQSETRIWVITELLDKDGIFIKAMVDLVLVLRAITEG